MTSTQKLEVVYWGLAIIVLAILCSSCAKEEEYGPQQKRMFAAKHSLYDYQQFVEKNQ